MKGLKVLALGAVMTSSLFAAGPHHDITCLGCHSAHYAVDHKIFSVKNEKMRNPINKETLDKLVAKNCLGCHETIEFGGAGVRPIHLHTTHPIGITPNPKIADVPANMLSDGKLDCTSCHEAHPSNKNFMYLRVDVGASGENIQNLCVTCHSAKGDLEKLGIKDAGSIKVFSAMDQEKGSGNFLRDEVRTKNATPKYVKPLGKLQPNDIVPNYMDKPAWVDAPEINPLEDMPNDDVHNKAKEQ
jgi:predicted CXXCH cytochrome family protein